ncbi:hypothetical protein PIB30_073159 [Stylosanthes scabra]|uniref:F-box domain-containing protein n=1 Tax=Stylosanthes scabra TaxID=79078 RepID=A0ABU6WNW8_9FABA|nr:hypothetical protein [Stylosanthes scabra]
MMHTHESSAAAVVENIDLLTKILLRLPTKDLLRSKCVCKKWRYLISEPQFCYRHTLGLCRRQKHNTYLYPSGFLQQRNNTRVYPKKDDSLLLKKVDIIPFTNNSKNRFIYLDVHDEFDGQLCYYFIRSCNGLLLWKSSPNQLPSSSLCGKLVQQCSFYVSNPTTGHGVRIDRFGHDFNASFSVPFLALEPWKSPHYKVIFFSKVVGGRDVEPTSKMKVSVYSSETGSWSKHDVAPSFPNDIKILKKDGLYCNGAIHWYVHGLSVYFDIDSLCLKNLPTLLPFTLPYPFIHGEYFVECRGNLHLIAKSSMQVNIYSIWELKEDYSGWIQKYTLNLTTLTTLLSSSLRSLCVVSQPPNEDEEHESMLAILLVGKDTVMSYNLEDHSSRIIYQGDAGSYGDLLARPYSLGGPYFETLVSV